MQRTRLLALLLAMMVSISMFAAGCGRTDSQPSEAANPTTQAETTKAEETAAPKEPQKLTVAQISWGTKLPAADADFVRNEIKKAINVDVELMNIDGWDEYKNQINVKIASGSPPDIFGVVDRNTLVQFSTNGVLLDITPYKEKLKEYESFVGEENLKKAYVNGKQYSITKAPNVNYNSIWIRKDWLDTLKLNVPATADELLEVAKAFSEKDPDGNGKKDTYGITGVKWATFAPINLAHGGGGIDVILTDDGKVSSSVLQPENKESMAIIKKFIDAKVVDPEWLVNTDAQVVDKIIQGKFGITYLGWANIAKKEPMEKIKAVNPNADWIQIDPLKGPKGQRISGFDVGVGNYWGLAAGLSKTPEKLQAAIDFINYISTPDGNKLVCYGVKDTHWKEEGGKIVITDTGKAEAVYTWLYQITGRNEMEYLSTKFVDQAPYIEFAASKWPYAKTYTGFVDKPEGYVHADAEKFLQEESTAYVYGKKDLAQYDKTIETLNKTYRLDLYLVEAEKKMKELGFLK